MSEIVTLSIGKKRDKDFGLSYKLFFDSEEVKKLKLEDVADFVEQGINNYMEPKPHYHIFCGPGRPATDEMIIAQLANHFTKRELRIMLNCISYGENDPAGLPGHNLIVIVCKLLGLTSITKELIQAAIVERQGEVHVDWNGDDYKGDNW